MISNYILNFATIQVRQNQKELCLQKACITSDIFCFAIVSHFIDFYSTVYFLQYEFLDFVKAELLTV